MKLVKDLERKRKNRPQFYFGAWNRNVDALHPCGTVACAVGRCPLVFPRQWKMDIDYHEPMLRRSTTDAAITDAERFFSLSYLEAEYLFTPRVSDDRDDKRLSRKATAKQVAARIRKFVASRS